MSLELSGENLHLGTIQNSVLFSRVILPLKNNISLYLIIVGVLSILTGCAPSDLPGTSASGPNAAGDNNFSFFINTLNFIFMGFFAYYFIVLKPKTQDEDNQKKFIEALAKNDEVVTSCGLIGRVVQKKSEIITLEISPKVNVKVLAKELRPLALEDKNQDKSLEKTE